MQLKTSPRRNGSVAGVDKQLTADILSANNNVDRAGLTSMPIMPCK